MTQNISKLGQNYLRRNEQDSSMECPAQSPDFNPVEVELDELVQYVCGNFGNRLGKNFPNIFELMPRRLARLLYLLKVSSAVISAEG